MDYKRKINKIFDDIDTVLQEGQDLPGFIRVPLREALEKMATVCNNYDNWELGIKSSEDRNKENLNKIFNSKPIKSSTYQFVAEFDGKYQPRVIDYMFKNGSPSWTDLNEDWSNGKMFTEQELPKVAKQLERYYAENGQGGASDIEIVKDNGESVYLEEFLQEGSFDKAWKRIEDDWLNDTMTK